MRFRRFVGFLFIECKRIVDVGKLAMHEICQGDRCAGTTQLNTRNPNPAEWTRTAYIISLFKHTHHRNNCLRHHGENLRVLIREYLPNNYAVEWSANDAGKTSSASIDYIFSSSSVECRILFASPSPWFHSYWPVIDPKYKNHFVPFVHSYFRWIRFSFRMNHEIMTNCKNELAFVYSSAFVLLRIYRNSSIYWWTIWSLRRGCISHLIWFVYFYVKISQ